MSKIVPDHPRLIRISHTDRRGTVATGDLHGATAVFHSTGWVRRPSSWSLASSAGRPVRAQFIRAVAARLESLGFECELAGVDAAEPAGDTAAEASARAASLTRARVLRRVSSLAPTAVQGRVDTLQSKPELSAMQTIELECLLEVRAHQIASGMRLEISQGTVSCGDRVRAESGWGTVVRANRRWAAVELDTGSTVRVPYAVIFEHQAF